MRMADRIIASETRAYTPRVNKEGEAYIATQSAAMGEGVFTA